MEKKDNTWSIVSFVTGLCILITVGFSGPFALWAGIHSKQKGEDSSLGTAGIVLGIIGCCFVLLFFIGLTLELLGVA